MAYSSTVVEVALARVLASEGGYVNDPHDPGGETNFGISKRAYPDVDIANLTVDQAREIYVRDYWRAIRGDELPPAVALVTFDAAVNMGIKPAVRLLQAALDLPEDGVVGPLTLRAAARARDPVGLASRTTRRRILLYAKLVGFPRYGASWVQRSLDVFRDAVEFSA